MDKQELKDWIKDNKGKVIALAIACFYLLISILFGKQGDWTKMLMFLILPLACIFFRAAMGTHTGLTALARPSITRTTPGCFVALAGWALLLLPLSMAILAAIFHWK